MASSEWASRPRTLPPTGRRKGTLQWCGTCEVFHRTHRHPQGEEVCHAIAADRQSRRDALNAGPAIRKIPKSASVGATR